MSNPQTGDIILRQNEIQNEFLKIQNWEEKYELIIRYGKNLPEFPEKFRIEENKVKGCQSQVWLFAELQNSKIHFYADSDALIVKGLIALVLKIYQDQAPQEILATELTVFEKIGLQQNLSQSRSNGFAAMLKQIRMFAIAFQYSLNTPK